MNKSKIIYIDITPDIFRIETQTFGDLATPHMVSERRTEISSYFASEGRNVRVEARQGAVVIFRWDNGAET